MAHTCTLRHSHYHLAFSKGHLDNKTTQVAGTLCLEKEGNTQYSSSPLVVILSVPLMEKTEKRWLGT